MDFSRFITIGRTAALGFILLVGISVASCSTMSKEEELAAANQGRPVEDLFNQAQYEFDQGNYKEASTLFDEVERQYPYAHLATDAQLMSAKSAYEDMRYDEAVVALDRFIELHPGHERIDYAYYLKALCSYEQITDVGRDQAMTSQALQALEAVVQRFPESQYAREATLKRDLTQDHLAGKEMEIGRYYLKQNQINAAINRFRTVVRSYQTTTHVPEALHRLVEAYLILGLNDEAVRVGQVLGYNYPGNRWYQETYALLDPAQRQQLLENRSWVSKTVDSLLGSD